MAHAVYRTVYGSAIKNSKQSLVTAMARYIEIIKTSAKNSIGIDFQGPIDITIIRPSGISVTSREDVITKHMFKELVGAKDFKVEFIVKGKKIPISKITREGCKVTFWYDEEKNQNDSINLEFATQYLDKHLNYGFFALFGTAHIIKKNAFRRAAESMNSRLLELWENVLRNYVGDSMTKSIEKYDLARYEIDAIVLNIFGNLIKVQKN